MEAFAEEVGACEGSDDFAGVFFVDVEEGVGGEEVDAAYVDAFALYLAVEELDEVACEESVALADVDVDAFHAMCCRATVFFFVVGGPVGLGGFAFAFGL